MKSLSINAFLNTLRNVLNMIFPLVTFPYVARILGAQNLGIYNFSNTFISYFLLIAGLGINTYAIREGAKYREDRKKLNNFVAQLYSINLVSTLISYILLGSVLVLAHNLRIYVICILIFSIQIFFTTIGVEWIYSIFEDYTYITIRSIFFKLISLILLFVLVKHKSDYLIYAAITVFASVGSNILNYIHVKKFCDIKITKVMKIKKHIKPILIIFASNIAILLYVNSGITLLGIMKNAYIVGIYSASTKIYSVLKTVLSSALIVTVPRLAMLYGKKNFNEYRKVASNVFNFLTLVTIPATIGLIIVSKSVILVLSGRDFVSATLSLQLLSIAAIFSIFSWFYNDCILIPAKKERVVLIATIVSAIVNILLNIVLIPNYNQNASAFATIIAELVGMIISIYYGRKVVTIKNFYNNFSTVVIASIGMAIIGVIINFLKLNTFISLIMVICLSGIAYLIMLIILKNKLVINIINQKTKG
ncbi:flippase [Limosilactobacillus reuteri]|uniref:flippase n=1 Tax=Limosilactobacillus reuteri TaxID=1598 RepID=UPI001E43D361|nr:flippase [Limosilactobacillus reuteri]MCC4412602.1 flippase [Limosilactobacillus reuteri]